MPLQSWTYPAEVHHVAAARHAVGDYATANAVQQPPLADIKLALTEAVMNAVLHGFRSTEPGTVTVSIEIDPETVSLRVADDGQGMGGRPDGPEPGMGMTLMAAMADRMVVGIPPTGTGTEVRMAFDYVAAGIDVTAAEVPVAS